MTGACQFLACGGGAGVGVAAARGGPLATAAAAGGCVSGGGIFIPVLCDSSAIHIAASLSPPSSLRYCSKSASAAAGWSR